MTAKDKKAPERDFEPGFTSYAQYYQTTGTEPDAPVVFEPPIMPVPAQPVSETEEKK